MTQDRVHVVVGHRVVDDHRFPLVSGEHVQNGLGRFHPLFAGDVGDAVADAEAVRTGIQLSQSSAAPHSEPRSSLPRRMETISRFLGTVPRHAALGTAVPTSANASADRTSSTTSFHSPSRHV
ncbi:hypothetical protein ACIGZI_32155 [Streptomyces griseus]|uniref:hypothetical protein n=1 Tax=Streptomyces griseus TaxID=1911 RepID=UPI0037D189E8